MGKAAGRLLRCVSPSVPHGHCHADCDSPLVDGERLFNRDCCNTTRGDGFKLKEGRFRLGTSKNFFIIRVVKHGNRFPREEVDAQSLETFKVRIGGALSNLIQSNMSLLSVQGVGLDDL